jgi:hypothetical protein
MIIALASLCIASTGFAPKVLVFHRLWCKRGFCTKSLVPLFEAFLYPLLILSVEDFPIQDCRLR